MTPRLEKVRKMLEKGLNVAQVARALEIAETSARVYISRVRRETGVPLRQLRSDNSGLEMTEDFAL